LVNAGGRHQAIDDIGVPGSLIHSAPFGQARIEHSAAPELKDAMDA
jgi:hypothetical protein